VTLDPRTASRKRRRIGTLIGAALLACGLSTLMASPASAADEGYVRLAHLSPDTPNVDVYLTPVTGATKAQTFPGVGYGIMTDYMKLPAGTYAVAMRKAGDPASTPPVLSTQVTVVAGKAYTVAGVGKYADLGLRVIDDNLDLPAANQSKVRDIQASVKSPVLNVSVAGGSTIANGVAFATTTGYQEVAPGRWTVQLQPVGSGTATTLSANLAAGGVYSLLVLDGKNGLTVQVRVDARGGGPLGGVDTGAGGTAPSRTQYPLLLGASVAALLGVALLGLRARRRRVHRTL
jgi:hypothetical protein